MFDLHPDEVSIMPLPIELRIYAEQDEYIRKHFGKKAQANMGWGVEAGDGFISVSTKVYGHGVLTSTSSRRSNRCWTPTEHLFEEF